MLSALALAATIVCQQPADDTSGYQFDKLTINYTLTPIEVFGDDQHATVGGDFDWDACYVRHTGAVSGEMTPKIWYGGAFYANFQVGDATARLTMFRSNGDAYVWLGGPDSTHLACTGDIPL
jgi:hypothetical protein